MAIVSARVRRAIGRLDRKREYAQATSPESIYLYQLSAAQRHGIFEPFDDEAEELNAWLLSMRAGRDLVNDAWDAFMAEAEGSADSAGE